MSTMTATRPNKKMPNPQDRIIGGNVRRIRNQRGISQEKLGEALGLTFQQVQKYEKGTNRIGGSRVTQICKALGCTVVELFTGTVMDGAPGAVPAEPDPCMVMGQTKIGMRMARAWLILPDSVRYALLDVAEKVNAELDA
jgi:transcriptional regulator with XRE-family HTH domain